MRVEYKLGLVSLVVIGLAASCGGRSGVELGDIDDLLDASVGGSGPSGYGGGVVDGSFKKDVGTDQTTPPPDVVPPKDVIPGSDSKDFFDTLPPWIPDTGPIGACVGCLQTKCGDQINACYNDTTCWQGIQCSIPKCFLGGGGGAGGSGGGGQINVQCFMDCFDNKMTSIMEALNMFQCITGTCGDACGLGGLAGNGGAAGGGLTSFHLDPNEAYAPPHARYIGVVRIPEPEEVSFAYPWLADVLEGRTPDPLPPSAKR
ncbi:MAG: hypothetical protein HY898_04490 [Deltaproteobacteria bacterium]|nr:hypothetical protein [Deltaproteobacteria bacterium]